VSECASPCWFRLLSRKTGEPVGNWAGHLFLSMAM